MTSSKPKHRFLRALTAGFLLLTASFTASAWEYTVSNNGNDANFDLISTAETGASYYNYFSWTAHPGFGTAADTAFMWLHENSNTGDLSLSMVLDAPGGNGGSLNGTFTSLPTGAYVSLADDGSEVSMSGANTANGNWHWIDCCTDGGVISGLEDGNAWSIDFDISAYTGINTWVFLSGPSNAPTTALVMNPGSTITVARSDSAEVPLPGTLLLLGAGLFGIVRRRTIR